MDKRQLYTKRLNEFKDIIYKISSSEIKTMEQMSIYCTLLGIDDMETFEFLMEWLFDADAETMASNNMYSFIINTLKKSNRFDKLITNKFITNLINMGVVYSVGKNYTISKSTVSDILSIDIRNPIILLRYFLSFENPKELQRINMINCSRMNNFYMILDCVITRCIMRATKLEKLKPIEYRLKNVKDSIISMNALLN